MEKEKQGSFADDLANRENRSNRTARFLGRLSGVVDFEAIAEELAVAYPAKTGRTPHDALLLFKMTLLQHFYSMSDPECEAQVADRRSFQEFCGLGLMDKVPDETTLVRFRRRLIAHGLHERLLGMVNAQLEARGLIVKAVTLVDATLIESARRKPSQQEIAERKETGSGKAAEEPQADYATKGGRAYYGYKAHIAADEEHTLIRRAEMSAASVHDSRKFQAICPSDTGMAIGDKAYFSAAHEAWLEERGIHSGLMEPARRNHPLSEEQREVNGWLASTRAAIERIFGHWKRLLHWRRLRYIGMAKGTLELQLKSIVWNLKRLVNLTPA
jgi:IS5 family transposase